MRQNFSQELRLEQRQILSQRMIMSMEILQLTLQQLEERIEQEMSENPVLEAVARDPSESSGVLAPTASGDEPPREDTQNSEDNSIPDNIGFEFGSFSEQDTDETAQAGFGSEIIEPEMKIENESFSNSVEEFALADEFAENYSGILDDESIRTQQKNQDDLSDLYNDLFANIPGVGQTFQSYLEEQLGWFDLSEDLHQMVLRIINNLDSKGYFPFELPDFLGEDQTPEELPLAQKALDFVRTLEPVGTAARNLRDCLLLQIPQNSPNSSVLRVIIDSHLEKVSENRIPSIAKTTGFSIDKIQEAVAELRHFNPIPSAGFGSEAAAVINPDVIVDIDEDGQYAVHLANERIPKLFINKTYSHLINNKQTDEATKEYIRKKMHSAQWLIDAVEQRQSTLRRVSEAILKYQIEFFRQGPQAIRPLKMQQIADELGIHITTVSRACNEKYMLTPEGIFPFRRFFATGLDKSDGEGSVANDVVQDKIKGIINNEDKNNPLSDDVIVQMLEEDGIKIARRTVVKYRQIMQIPSSRGRKMWKT